MAFLKPPMFEEVCRACIKQNRLTFQSVFDYVDDFRNEKIQIFELLNETLHKLPKIEVLDDELPKNICTECVEKLCAFSEFQNRCIASDLELRKLVSSSFATIREEVEQSDPLNHPTLPIEESIKKEIVDADGFTVTCFSKTALTTILTAYIQVDEENEISKTINYDKNDLKCHNCDLVYKSKDSLRQHMKLHERPGVIKTNRSCELCDQGHRTTKKLLEHYETVHPERLYSKELPVPKDLKCIFCPLCKKGVKNLNCHQRSHSKERPFLCSICGKDFGSTASLKQHTLRHSDEKRYSCNECPKRFTSISSLCNHRHIHKKDKPHVCDTCGKGFKKTHELTVHKRIHDERKFKCEYCGKDFVGRTHLNRHILSHTGEKPYKCKYCPRSFSQSNDLIKHLRTHLGENVYQCELCPSAFTKASERRTHFSMHIHDDEETRERNKLALFEVQEKLRLKFQENDTAVNESVQTAKTCKRIAKLPHK